MFQSTEGIILRSTPFRDYDQILSLFTLDSGLIKVFHKRQKKETGKKLLGCEPLTQVEIIYREKKSDIFSCHEIKRVNSFYSLRQNLLFLEVACDLLQVISVSQFDGKAAPQLYKLLCVYLKKIPQTVCPWILAISFRLKLLRHEGLIIFPFACHECHKILYDQAFILNCEGWCQEHQPLGSQLWSETDLQVLYKLALSQSYQEICNSSLSLQLRAKIIEFFDRCIH